VIPEGDDVPRVNPPLEGGRDLLAERRARRAGLASQALLSRTEAAEATVRTLETHLADLRRREVEAEHERERALAQLAERDRELRRVKQREYAEQQQRVEAEEAAIRVRRGHRAELDRLQRRVEQAHAAAQHAEERRAALAVHLAAVNDSCVRLERGITALQGVATELRDTFERDHLAAQARIAELERQLAPTPKTERDEPAHRVDEPAHREEMAGALAAAVERLRARAAPAPEATPIMSPAPETPVATAQEPIPEIPTVVVVPRLFLSSRSGRLRPTVRRIAMRLAEWADRTQTPPS
jgi:chromosome segregation ATPase